MLKFFKKQKEVFEGIDDTKPRGVKYTIERLSESEFVSIQNHKDSMKNHMIDKVDKMVLQEISDRLYGPQSEDYVKALLELNKSFKPRAGKSFHDFYEPGISDNVRENQKKINESIKHES